MFAVAAAISTGSAYAGKPAMQPMTSLPVMQQDNNTCTGQVVDANGDPIVGATIMAKGTTHGTITDLDGKFSLSNVKAGTIIIVSYVGYEKNEIIWRGGSLNVTLKESTQTMDQVVVIGYGSVRKADLAGSVAVMNDKAFRDQPIKNVSEAFQGRVTGINVVQSGVPGGGVKIRVRGTSSIHRNNDPLYVVDGIVRENGLDGINTEDIQSIQVLKERNCFFIVTFIADIDTNFNSSNRCGRVIRYFCIGNY